MGARVFVGFNASVGDSVYASLTQIAGNRWSIYLIDLNSGAKIAKTVEYAGPRQSADFIHSVSGSGQLARTSPFSFYNARVNGTAAFVSLGTQATDLIVGGDVLARPSYYNEAHDAFTVTDGPDRPAAPVDQLFQRHSDGSIWESNGDSCQTAPGCTGEWTGQPCSSATVCTSWEELDNNQGTVQISVSNGSLPAP